MSPFSLIPAILLAQYTFGELPPEARLSSPCQVSATVDEAIAELAREDTLRGQEALQEWLDVQELARQSKRARGCEGW